MERAGRTIELQTKHRSDKTGPRSYQIEAETDEDAAAIETALPAVTTAESIRAIEERRELREFDKRLRRATPHVVITPTLICINVAIFVVMAFAGGGILGSNLGLYVRWGADFAPLTTHGESWRLFTSVFLHFGILHLLLNMWALYGAGVLTERLYGSICFGGIYVFAGLAGSIVSVIWHPSMVSAGASGAIFGVYGALLIYLVARHESIPRKALSDLRNSTLWFVVYALISGFQAEGSDNAAHVGGFVGGCLQGLVSARPLDRRRRSESPRRRLVVATLLASTLFTAAWLVTHPLHAVTRFLLHDFAARIWSDPTDARGFAMRAVAFKKQGDIERAIHDYDEAIRLDPQYVVALNNRGNLFGDRGDYDSAIRDYDQAIRLDPSFTNAFYNRGRAYLQKGNNDEAVKDLDRSIQLDPTDPDAFNNRGLAHQRIGDADRAIQDFDQAVRLNPRSAQAIGNRARTYANKGDYEQAIQDYTATIRLAPRSALAHYGRGVAKMKKGDTEGANADIAAARAITADVAEEFARGDPF